MSVGRFLQQAAAGNAGEAVYVDDVFSTYLYVGTQAAGNVIDNGMNLDESNDGGGLVWIKPRTVATSNFLFDTKRPEDGVTNNGYLKSDTTDAAPSGIADFSFNTGGNTGFTVGATSVWNDLNEDHCSWTFRKQPGFFDIVTYTGDGTAGRTVNHNLGSVPGFMVVKKTNSTSDFTTYHRSMGATKYAPLNDTDAYNVGSAIWNNTEPTATEFTVGDNTRMNNSGDTYVAYLFAHDAQDFGTDSDESIIKCGSYTGNGSTTSNDIDIGFEPQWVLIKNTTSNNQWYIFDVMRGIASEPGGDAYLLANTSGAEVSSENYIDILPNGFSLRDDNAAVNASSSTYIYIAIRRPHKPASEFAATDLFDPVEYTGNAASTRQITTGFPVDLTIGLFADYGSDKNVFDRIRGASARLVTHGTAAETSTTAYMDGFDTNDGVIVKSTLNSSGDTWNGFMFRRAPGFFDVVAYTGTNSGTQNVNHNLGVTPELMIGKGRDYATNWYVFVNGVTNSGFLQSDGSFSNSYRIGAPTSTTFEVRGINSTASSLNGPHDYIAYLFATVAGISKVGTYSGTGSDVNVDCGFSAGARFVMVKRSDSTGDWYVWDTERGIVAGNDPYTRMNNNVSDTTNTDYIDPLSSGFTITSSAPAALNASGGTYIFLAIA